MNNTKRNLTAIAAILMTATLVVGTLAITTTTTKIAFAANNNSGNTVTAQINRQHGSGSGFDNDPEQEAQNTICTHPGENSACVQEGAAATTTTPVTPATGTLLVKKVVVCEGDTVKAIVIRICPKPEDFTITVTGNNPTPSTFQGSTSGTLVTLGVGPYKVTEVEHESFEATFSTDCNGTIAPGDQKTCTITNTEEK